MRCHQVRTVLLKHHRTFDEAFAQQVEFDLLALESAIARALPEAERQLFRSVQLQAQRWTSSAPA